ncbi:helix-turn-helix transcriptional regulator [Arthrobacter globiformis]|uniref:helix-turn-helix transcriptional regulator n=1 Tax=Arthrobacter globiformis TaxID=1665 RepID=UPI002790999B|nr:helix-turn-helix transcriptional regulator [Arthrobacter globiformis]MDQ0619720.1 DNA-binding CsgD family transcriptional regulator [Arthrobacter globiformis]
MERNDAQYRTWLELVGEILQLPCGPSLRYEEQLLELYTESFDGACSTRNHVRHDWDNRIITCWPPKYIPDEPPGDFDYRQQPLLRWYAWTGQRGPQSIGRVPDALASNNIKQAWDEIARPWNVNHQLSIPLHLGGNDLHSYLVQRPDDFTEQEFDLASLLQPILTGLAFHLRLASTSAEASVQGSTQGLTVREMGILTLLSKGLTADSLARRLNISPRTAEKHLEHIYRKLDVGDRLMAVQRGYELRLLDRSPLST